MKKINYFVFMKQKMEFIPSNKMKCSKSVFCLIICQANQTLFSILKTECYLVWLEISSFFRKYFSGKDGSASA